MLNLTHAHFAYTGSAPIVRDVSLSVERGQVVAVMGPSGCGKTTLLRLIAGLLKPSSGEASIMGEPLPYDDAKAMRALRTKIGMLFQIGALFTDMSVFDKVAFPLR